MQRYQPILLWRLVKQGALHRHGIPLHHVLKHLIPPQQMCQFHAPLLIEQTARFTNCFFERPNVTGQSVALDSVENIRDDDEAVLVELLLFLTSVAGNRLLRRRGSIYSRPIVRRQCLTALVDVIL
jgi:hypothetical protein